MNKTAASKKEKPEVACHMPSMAKGIYGVRDILK